MKKIACSDSDAEFAYEGKMDHEIEVSPEVREFILKRGCDFRVCTSCGGPILLPTSVKRPKKTDIRIPIGERMLYVSIWQAPYIDVIDRDMIPRYWYPK